MPEALFAAGGVLARNEPEPGRELATVLELPHVTDASHDRRSGDRADTLALEGELRILIFASVRCD